MSKLFKRNKWPRSPIMERIYQDRVRTRRLVLACLACLIVGGFAGYLFKGYMLAHAVLQAN